MRTLPALGGVVGKDEVSPVPSRKAWWRGWDRAEAENLS